MESADSLLIFPDTDSISGGRAIHTGPVGTSPVATLRSQSGRKRFFRHSVFAVILLGYLLLAQRISEDSLLAQAAAVVTALSMILAPILAAVLAYHRVDPDLDSYTSSRFKRSFLNGSWPTLSMEVRSECLPEGATYIKGCIVAVRDKVGEYHLTVVVESGSDARTVLDGTTKNPSQGWMQVMGAVLKAQLGDLDENLKWQKRIPISGRLRRGLSF